MEEGEKREVGLGGGGGGGGSRSREDEDIMKFTLLLLFCLQIVFT